MPFFKLIIIVIVILLIVFLVYKLLKRRFQNEMRDLFSEYTRLEKNLLLEQEKFTDLVTILKGLIHDLKSPFYQTLLQNEDNLRNLDINKIAAETILFYNIEQMDEGIKQINKIIRFLDSDLEKTIKVHDRFEITSIFKQVRLGLKNIMDERGMYLNAIMPEELFVKLNKMSVRLIIHNLLFNAINYAVHNSEIEFHIYIEDNHLYMICNNETNELNIKRLKNNQNNEVGIAVLNNQEYNYSTGKGIHLIKELSKILNGEHRILIKDKQVSVGVRLPLLIDNSLKIE